jgi:hypothetical protein
MDSSHSLVEIDRPKGWKFFVSHHDGHVKRLVIFVHGFGGQAVGSWLEFPFPDTTLKSKNWWDESDLLFVGYDSKKEEIVSVAGRIRMQISKFYPQPFAEAMQISGWHARKNTDPYNELFIVGHSLGGVVVRRALCDEAQSWIDNGKVASDRPVLLQATTRLFSPASFGFRPTGLLGQLRAMYLWRVIEIFLRRSPAYSDLQPNSKVLNETHDRTIELLASNDPALQALRAHTLWANPDGVVIVERYSTDHVDTPCDENPRDHGSVCKPQAKRYEAPWVFVETGKV